MRNKLFQLLDKADKPISIDYISHQLQIHWWTAYRLVAETVFDELQNHPELLRRLPFVPMKSTKSLVIIPKSCRILDIKIKRR
jgi:hypothetical protein